MPGGEMQPVFSRELTDGEAASLAAVIAEISRTEAAHAVGSVLQNIEVHQIGPLRDEVRSFVRPSAPEPFDPAREYRCHERAICRGGTWTVVSPSGGQGEAPGPDARRWICTSDGVASVDVEQRDARLDLTVKLASGAEQQFLISLPTLRPRGTWHKADSYQKLDIVTREGGSFVALRNAPGECPGPGWQVLTMRGQTRPGRREGRGRPSPRRSGRLAGKSRQCPIPARACPRVCAGRSKQFRG